ncbi:MAG: PHP domain-containing protein [Chitinophagales bacterium]
MKLIADYHTHTRQSDGQGTVEQNVRAARRRGLEAVAITNHGPASLFGIGVKRPEVLLEVRRETRRIQDLYPDIEVLAGVEANVVSGDGDLDVPADLLRDLDVVLVGLHPMVRFSTLGDAARLGALNLAGRSVHALRGQAREGNTWALIEAVTRHEVDIITHPGLHLAIDTPKLAAACAKVGTALEISAGHPYMTPEFVEVAREEGALFAIGSDAHTPDNVGRLEAGLEIAEAADLDPKLVLNALH